MDGEAPAGMDSPGPCPAAWENSMCYADMAKNKEKKSYVCR